MGLFSTKTLAGPGYIVLNVLRAFNIVTLLAIAAAAIVLLIKIHINDNFFFFEAVSHVITLSLSFFLILSETPLCTNYFATHHPLLSPLHSFTFLGLLLLGLGTTVLGNLNNPNYTSHTIGLGFWRVTLGAGILGIVIGVFNILASFIFRQKAPRVTARMIRSKGAVALTCIPPQTPWDQLPGSNTWNGSQGASSHRPTTASTADEKRGLKGWKHRFSIFKSGTGILPTYTEKANGARPKISRPLKTQSQESLVDMRDAHTVNSESMFHGQAGHGNHGGQPANGGQTGNAGQSANGGYSGNGTYQGSAGYSYRKPTASSYYSNDDERRSMQISGPLNVNPQFKHLVPQFATLNRPDSTYHPARYVPGRYPEQ
ncbi:MAG: hypothetical protein Q9162_005547 [Coniocarpon cinnabarinum]